jgi:hypothetical protein
MKTMLETYTFQVTIEKVGEDRYTASTTGPHFAYGSTAFNALMALYILMAENYFHSFRLEVYEGEKLIQELVYREAH